MGEKSQEGEVQPFHLIIDGTIRPEDAGVMLQKLSEIIRDLASITLSQSVTLGVNEPAQAAKKLELSIQPPPGPGVRYYTPETSVRDLFELGAITQEKLWAQLRKMGKEILSLRVDSRLSQEKLAELTGLSKSLISVYESGYHSKTHKPLRPRLDSLRIINSALGADHEKMLKLAGYEIIRDEPVIDDDQDLREPMS